MPRPSEVSEALGIAIRMEQDGQKSYAEAAVRTRHPFGKEMFQSLAADERRHEQVFREMADREGVRPAAMDEIDRHGPIKRISAIFRSMAEEIERSVRPTDDDTKVLVKAMELERRAFEFYTETAALAAEPTERDILRKIANEENEHYRLLDDTLLYLTSPEEWHLKEERPLIDGG